MFTDWQGQLMGTFHSSPGGLKTVITDMKALTPEVTVIYYHHPHHQKKAGQMSVRAYPPDVYRWLRQYQHVTIPESLDVKLKAVNPLTIKALEFIVEAETKEQINVPSANPVMSAMFGQQARPVSTAFRMEPWYFVIYTRHKPANGKAEGRASVKIETADLLAKLMDPSLFSGIDHDAMYSYLLSIRVESLAEVWILKPDYFDVLKAFSPERWQTLFERAQKGLISGSK